MKIGDKLRFTPWPWSKDRTQWGEGITIPTAITGRVIYIHPQGRYYLVAGEVEGRPIRECYSLRGG